MSASFAGIKQFWSLALLCCNIVAAAQLTVLRCLTLLCSSHLKCNWNHARLYISPSHSIHSWHDPHTYLVPTSSYSIHFLHSFDVLLHSGSSLHDLLFGTPASWGVGLTRSLMTQRSRRSRSCKSARSARFQNVSNVQYPILYQICILLYLAVSYCSDSDSPNLPCFGTNHGCSAVALISIASENIGNKSSQRQLSNWCLPLPPACQLRAWH